MSSPTLPRQLMPPPSSDDLFARYATDVVGFATDLCGLTGLQTDFLEASTNLGVRLAARVVGCPVDRELAVLAVHNMLCNPESITLLSVNHMARTETGVWREVRRVVAKLRDALPPQARLSLTNNSAQVRLKDAPASRIRLVSNRCVEAVAGLHCKEPGKVMCLMSEAGGTPDRMFDVLKASLDRSANRWIMAYEWLPTWFMRQRHENGPLEFDPRGFTLLDIYNPVGKAYPCP